MTIYREVASVYATIYEQDESPYKLAVDVVRFTNSPTWGKGRARLLAIARKIFYDKFVDEHKEYDKHEGYMHDKSEYIDMPLNRMVQYTVEQSGKLGGYFVRYEDGTTRDTQRWDTPTTIEEERIPYND